MAIDVDRFRRRLSEQPATLHVPGEQNVSPENPSNNLDGITGDNNPQAAKLDQVTTKALDKADEILGLQLPDNENFGPVLRAQSSTVNTVLNTSVRVNEGRLRQQRFDRLPELLKLIADEEKRLPARLLIEAPANEGEPPDGE